MTQWHILPFIFFSRFPFYEVLCLPPVRDVCVWLPSTCCLPACLSVTCVCVAAVYLLPACLSVTCVCVCLLPAAIYLLC